MTTTNNKRTNGCIHLLLFFLVMIFLLLLFIMFKWHAKFRYIHTNIHRYTHTHINNIHSQTHSHFHKVIVLFLFASFFFFVCSLVGSFKCFLFYFYFVVVFILCSVKTITKWKNIHTQTQQHNILKPWGWIKDVRLLFLHVNISLIIKLKQICLIFLCIFYLIIFPLKNKYSGVCYLFNNKPRDLVIYFSVYFIYFLIRTYFFVVFSLTFFV